MTDSDRKNNGIKSCNEIDLRSHAVVEASAGTGKTYTITGLVVRLVLGITEPLKELSGCLGTEMIKVWNLKGITIFLDVPMFCGRTHRALTCMFWMITI